MKTTMQILQWKNWRMTQLLLTISLTLAVANSNATAASTDPNPMCARFVGDPIGMFKVPFTLVFVKEQFSAVLNDIN